ncbi:hypothetical protein [Oharaeibacter diazotrophicus]|uniref:Uncharacterized protein n=1 Tax=Oharaeibacter diazotrophicus TaxID=1920512 RepID=A0A4R6RFQ6_9HYPH|nr:hypothetical protein [Oharaeibacter diazotrophicus]TDP84935.1 hypothetical protein EDD54_1779 [Oharaeibacter diazotrophicus]BBE73906.1 tetratricopeptide repeat protein [Pleomorphomonas sp. SM30]GLS76409.1 hypothetical protein GCM10007904_17440 [Oharaeibacter diazotrophicus]
MRSFWPSLLAVLLLAAGPVRAEETLLGPLEQPAAPPRQADRTVRSALADSGRAELDDLFARLASAKSAGEAHPAEQKILQLWTRSGSATVDLMMGWADKAIGEKNYPRALDLLDEVLVLKPDFAEGYNRRATVHYLTDDYRLALRDIRATLALEPRHFGALSGFGAILADIGDTRRAEEIFRKALALHPNLTGVKERLDDLEAADKGSPT